jgi:transcriptional regulator with XRE-family HTH domain
MFWDCRIEELLERSGLSLREFAAELGLSHETVRRWLPSFGQEPTLSLAVAFSGVTGWTVDQLLGSDPLVGPWRIAGPVLWMPMSTGFAASLFAIARARDISLRRLAEESLVPSRTLYAWTQGRSEPGIYNASRVAEALGETLHDMAAGPAHCRTLRVGRAA